MKSKTTFAVLLINLLVLAVASVTSADEILTEKTDWTGRYIGATSSALGCFVGGVDPDEAQRGLVVGCTFHDFQKYGSMGRQISSDNVFGTINFTWTNQDSPNSDTQDVRYDGYSGGILGDNTGGAPVGHFLTAPDTYEFVTLASTSNGTMIYTFQWITNPTSDPKYFRTYVFKNNTPGLADFVGYGGVGFSGRIPDSAWDGYLVGNANTFIWPQIAYTEIGATKIAHLVISSDRTDGDNTALYLRKVDTTDWETVMELGPAGFHRSFIIANSRITERVGVAFSGGRGDGTLTGAPISRYNGQESGKNDNDLYVIISNDAGATWGSLTNVTQRPDSLPGGFVPHAKLSALFDANDDFVVAYQTRQWPGYDGAFTNASRMNIWNESVGVPRIAADGAWTPTDCEPGFQQLNIDNPQLSECAGKLFLTFTMFAPVSLGLGDDCAERAFSGAPNAKVGAANADIYISVSGNSGFNWDAPRNLTQTYTPNCDTILDGANPDCGSEAWHSAIRYGIDITLDIYSSIPDFTSRLDPTYVTGVGEYLFMQY
ncbi:hypothetical protein JYU03_00390, partial [bacterium AH-315-F03]|nr:hypothetical protein [bacterium AH-315-F03]